MSSDSIKLVIFKLSTEEFGIEITKINNIVRMQEITQIPYAANWIEGVINFRGKPLIVIDLRKKFGLPSKKENLDDQRIMVLDFHPFLIGIIVDYVSEVLTLPFHLIEPVPENLLSLEIEQEFLLGVGNLDKGERLIILLDLGRIFSEQELEELGVFFDGEEKIKRYLEKRELRQSSVEKNRQKTIQALQSSLDLGVGSSKSSNSLLVNQQQEMERQMIRRLALREMSEELGIDLVDSSNNREEVIYVDENANFDEDEDVEYVYEYEDGTPMSPEDIAKLKQGQSNVEVTEIDTQEEAQNFDKEDEDEESFVIKTADSSLSSPLDSEIADLIAAVDTSSQNDILDQSADTPIKNDDVAALIDAINAKKEKAKSEDQAEEKMDEIVEESDDNSSEITSDMIESFKSEIRNKYTKKELVAEFEKYGLNIDSKMKKAELVETIAQELMQKDPTVILSTLSISQ